MKNFRRTSLVALVLLVILAGCSPDPEAPVQAGQSLVPAMNYHDKGPFCSETQYFKMVDDNGNFLDLGGAPYGSMSMDYNSDSTYYTVILGAGWFIDKAAWYVGSVNNVPLTQNGLINTAAFPESANPAIYVNSYTFESDFVDPGPNCLDVIFWCEIVMVDFFQGPIQSTRRGIWAAQAPWINGFMIENCYEPCYLTSSKPE